MPTISVITATHNRAKNFLPKAIKSVLNQTFKDFEYIVVDDASTDHTEQVVKRFDYDKRIKYIKLEENTGTHTAPLNRGIMESTGEYIAYLDDDNEWYPYHLEVLKKAVDNGVDVAYCDMMVDYGDKMEQGIAMDFDSQFLLNRNFIDTSNVLHKRDIIFAVGGWDETIKRFTDWNLWVRMMKWGAKFQRVPIVATKYSAHEGDTQSKRTEVNSWYDPRTGLTMFEPTFDPSGCFIYKSYLDKREEETNPKVAIYTLTYDRLDYTKRMAKSMFDTAGYPFDWFVFDQGSEDGTGEWLDKYKKIRYLEKRGENVGITKGSNAMIDAIKDRKKEYQIIIKIDNDCEFMTKDWLKTVVDLWKRNHKLYMSPYPEGLVHNPGGAPRIGYSYIGPYFVEVTRHIGGFFAAIDARAHDEFRWKDQFKHGNQDMEASMEFRKQGYMPCYVPLHRIMHMNTTSGQHKDYPDYFERRKKEKTEVA